MSRTVFQRSGLCLTLLALLSMPVEATTVTDSRQITTTGQTSFYGNNAEGTGTKIRRKKSPKKNLFRLLRQKHRNPSLSPF